MSARGLFKPSRAALTALLLLALLPPLALLAYGLSSRWDRSLLPQGWTLDWMAQALADARVQAAAGRTLLLASASALAALLLGGAATLASALQQQLSPATASTRRLAMLLDAVALLPYAIPPVVMAIGALDLFVGRWGQVLSLPLVYVAVVTPTLFPLVHKTLRAALLQLGAAQLIEAGRTLGASDLLTLRRVLLPLLAPALAAALLLSWITATMEFAIANLLLGGEMELLQPLMYALRNADGHQSAALISLAFVAVALLAFLVQRLSAWTPKNN